MIYMVRLERGFYGGCNNDDAYVRAPIVVIFNAVYVYIVWLGRWRLEGLLGSLMMHIFTPIDLLQQVTMEGRSSV